MYFNVKFIFLLFRDNVLGYILTIINDKIYSNTLSRNRKKKYYMGTFFCPELSGLRDICSKQKIFPFIHTLVHRDRGKIK